MAALPAIAAVATIVGTAVTVGATIFGGKKEQEADYAEAALLEVRGREEFAAAQREALQRRREGKLLESRQQAVAAASGAGAGADDPTIVKLMTETGELTEYAASTIMYGGLSRRDAYYQTAGARRRGGDATLLGSIIGGVGRGIGGISALRDL